MSERSEQLSQMTLVVMGLGDREAKKAPVCKLGLFSSGVKCQRETENSSAWPVYIAFTELGTRKNTAGVTAASRYRRCLSLQGRRLAKDGYPGRR